MHWTREKFTLAVMAASFMFVVLAGADCGTGGIPGGDPNGGGQDGGGNDGGDLGLTVVKTAIALHVQGRIEAGDGIVAYGTGGFAGVDYINVGDTAGRGVTNGANFKAKSFAVCGKKIIFDENFQLTVFDTTDASSTAIPLTDIRVARTPASVDEGGHFQSDGNLVGVMNDAGSVTDGKEVKVIDVSAAAPNVISFDVNPASSPAQIAVDASNPHVAVVANHIFYIYDVANPTTAPVQWDVSGLDGVDNATQMRFSGGYILYHDNAAFGNARLLDTTDGTVVAMTSNPAAQTLAMAGGKYAYFVNRDAADSFGTVNRSGIGDVPTAAAVLAGDTQITAGTDNNGFVGWGQTAAITPNGAWFFLAGFESIGQQEYLMAGTGGAFGLVPDPADASADGLQASDVSATATTVAFKVGSNNDTTVGYITLP